MQKRLPNNVQQKINLPKFECAGNPAVRRDLNMSLAGADPIGIDPRRFETAGRLTGSGREAEPRKSMLLPRSEQSMARYPQATLPCAG